MRSRKAGPFVGAERVRLRERHGLLDSKEMPRNKRANSQPVIASAAKIPWGWIAAGRVAD